MAIWGAVIGGVVAAGSAYYSSSQQKKAAEKAAKQRDEEVDYGQQQLADRKNSMGARMAPYLMDQMLRVYAEQSKGRGGFNLPIDEILANMNIEGRKKGEGSFGGGGASASYGTYMGGRSKEGLQHEIDSSYLRRLDPDLGDRVRNGPEISSVSGASGSLRGNSFDNFNTPISLQYGKEQNRDVVTRIDPREDPNWGDGTNRETVDVNMPQWIKNLDFPEVKSFPNWFRDLINKTKVDDTYSTYGRGM